MSSIFKHNMDVIKPDTSNLDVDIWWKEIYIPPEIAQTENTLDKVQDSHLAVFGYISRGDRDAPRTPIPRIPPVIHK